MLFDDLLQIYLDCKNLKKQGIDNSGAEGFDLIKKSVAVDVSAAFLMASCIVTLTHLCGITCKSHELDPMVRLRNVNEMDRGPF